MRRRLTHWLVAAGLAAALSRPFATHAAEAAASPELAQEEKEGCTKNLNLIYQAIQAYQTDHQDLPNWLSDLVPQYLADANVLICPVCRRTGKTESPPLADPKLPSSYLFEFCPVPLGSSAPNARTRTRREWKRRQMGLIGSVVPIVRCRHHSPVLNLGFDGTVYESPLFWELNFTNRVKPSELTAANLFAQDGSDDQGRAKPAVTRHFSPRDPAAGERLLDLTKYYNAMFSESWHGNVGNDLSGLPTGLQTFAGVQFDIRGIVQLAGKSGSSTNFPAEVKGIPVRQKCRHLTFLHAAGFGASTDEGRSLGAYIVHYGTNQLRLEIPIIYGRAVRNWHELAGEPEPNAELKVAWTGDNAVSKQSGRKLRLFTTTWTNLLPDFEIESIDFVSSLSGPAPFLIAITAD